MKFQLHLSSTGITPAVDTVELKEGDRNCAISWPILPAISMQLCCGPAANLLSKDNLQLLISLQDTHKLLKLRIFSGNAQRAKLEAQQDCETSS